MMKTTDSGYVNRNNQEVVRATGLEGTDHLQRVYVLRCGLCLHQYGANGSDIIQRKMPKVPGRCSWPFVLNPMVRVLPEETFYRIRDPRNFHAAMRADVNLLLSHRAYLSLSTVIMCCLDALAAEPGDATRGKFEAFIKKYFTGLNAALEAASPGKSGAAVLYDSFRNGFAHLRGPKPAFAIAEDHELEGNWAERVKVGDSEVVVINIDRLTREFLLLLDRLEAAA